ncbi:MAG: hypothetical protein D6694_05190 [Gammaproteobacteria bacterium]|nr:MAG: hypothetical protein D6694_05190 [Gammaproteobacteria bacterium]
MKSISRWKLAGLLLVLVGGLVYGVRYEEINGGRYTFVRGKLAPQWQRDNYDECIYKYGANVVIPDLTAAKTAKEYRKAYREYLKYYPYSPDMPKRGFDLLPDSAATGASITVSVRCSDDNHYNRGPFQVTISDGNVAGVSTADVIKNIYCDKEPTSVSYDIVADAADGSTTSIMVYGIKYPKSGDVTVEVESSYGTVEVDPSNFNSVYARVTTGYYGEDCSSSGRIYSSNCGYNSPSASRAREDQYNAMDFCYDYLVEYLGLSPDTLTLGPSFRYDPEYEDMMYERMIQEHDDRMREYYEEEEEDDPRFSCTGSYFEPIDAYCDYD